MLSLVTGRVTPLRDTEPDLLRQPPFNAEAEQALLGAIFINNNAYFRVCDFLAPEHFGNAVHARIYTAIGRVLDTGQAANPVTLRSYFDVDQSLQEIGGGAYLAKLAGAAVTIINTEDYARLIVDLYQRRQLMIAGEDLTAMAWNIDFQKPATKVIEEFEGRLTQIAEGKQAARHILAAGSIADAVVLDTEAAFKDGEMFIPTGLKRLDEIIGGFLAGDLEILASRPGMGKTALALGISYRIAERGIPGLYFSLEQTSKQLVQRILADRTGISVMRQMGGKVDMVEMHQLIDAAAELKALPLYFDDNAGLPVSQIGYRARRARQRQKIGFIVVDHLQLVAPNSKKEARRLELDEISGSLKMLAKDLDIPVLALSQLTRGVEGREDKRPTLADLRESGGLEQDADPVMFVYREEYYAQRAKIDRREGEDDEHLAARLKAHNDRLDACRGLADVFIAKNRHGESNKRADLAWDAERMRFSDLATDVDLARFGGM